LLACWCEYEGKEEKDAGRAGEAFHFGTALQVMVEVGGGTPGCFCEECENKGVILKRVKKSVQVIENKGRKIGGFLNFLAKSERE
jgi:hypothetical protein